MKDDDSIYHLFSSLSEFIKHQHIPVREKEKPSAAPQAKKPTDEAHIFLEAMKDVKKVDRKNQRMRSAVPEAPPPQHVRSKDDHRMEDTLKEDYTFNVVNLPEYMEGYVEGTNPLVMEKLRRGEFSVQKVLDLHGLSAQDAYDTFHTFMEDAIHSQIRCLKVIHGRGLKSKSGPVLKERLKDWLVRAMHRKWVVAFSSCKMKEGGPGATVILLRTRAHKKKLHIIG